MRCRAQLERTVDRLVQRHRLTGRPGSIGCHPKLLPRPRQRLVQPRLLYLGAARAETLPNGLRRASEEHGSLGLLVVRQRLREALDDIRSTPFEIERAHHPQG